MNALILALILLPLSQQDPLQQFRWENRLVIIVDDESTLAVEQLEAFDAMSDDMAVRHMKLLIAKDNHISVGDETFEIHQLRGALGLKDGRFQVILIGKDGGIKFRSDTFVHPKQVFDLVDTMPMRRAEMRRNNP